MFNKPFLAYWSIGRKLLSSRGPAAYRHRPLPKSLKIFSETTGWICFKSGMKLPCVNVCQEFSVFQFFFFFFISHDFFFPKKISKPLAGFASKLEWSFLVIMSTKIVQFSTKNL